jgi:DNA-binding LytR/AlgR family response regulator
MFWLPLSRRRTTTRCSTSARAHLVRSSLHVLEARLAAQGFVRLSRSAIVNMSRVRDLGPDRDGQLVQRLRGGVELPVSRRRR